MILPFGKYKGHSSTEIVKIDPSYLYWLVDQNFVSDKFPYLYSHVVDLLGIRQESIEMSGSIRAIVARVCEALTYRGFTEEEAQQMVDRLLSYNKGG